MRYRITLAVAVVAVFASIASAKDIALISNKANHVQAVSMEELVKICKAQASHLPDGKPVTLIVRDPASPDMKIVLERVYGMSKSEVDELITHANRGRTDHPAVMVAESDQDLVKRVESTVGAVGLVDVYAITGGVDVVKVSGKLPLEPGYILHGN